MRESGWFRFGGAALGAIAGALVAIGAATLVGVPGYLFGILVLVPAVMVVAAAPWGGRDVLFAAAGTLLGLPLVLMVVAMFDVVFGGASPALILAAVFASVFYFTGVPTVIGLLACIVLAGFNGRNGHSAIRTRATGE
ncbi:MAG: hypothetical protein M0R74_10745 [Dehalococcoidia bacterium]|nr:hypothetical protein [Dehalococcoidia bacterium]